MPNSDAKEDLRSYLEDARETLIWKLEGLNEYDVRRPLTPMGTNLLGLVKHSTATHLGYFGEVFGRFPNPSAGRFSNDAGPAAEFWVTAEESSRRSSTAISKLGSLPTPRSVNST